jgi:hypothetical protein
MNQLHALAMNEGFCWKKKLFSEKGRAQSDTPRGAGGLVSGAASKAVVPLVEASR